MEQTHEDIIKTNNNMSIYIYSCYTLHTMARLLMIVYDDDYGDDDYSDKYIKFNQLLMHMCVNGNFIYMKQVKVCVRLLTLLL